MHKWRLNSKQLLSFIICTVICIACLLIISFSQLYGLLKQLLYIYIYTCCLLIYDNPCTKNGIACFLQIEPTFKIYSLSKAKRIPFHMQTVYFFCFGSNFQSSKELCIITKNVFMEKRSYYRFLPQNNSLLVGRNADNNLIQAMRGIWYTIVFFIMTFPKVNCNLTISYY